MKSIRLKIVCVITQFLLSSFRIKQARFCVLEETQLRKAYESKRIWVAVDKIKNHYKSGHDHKAILKLS